MFYIHFVFKYLYNKIIQITGVLKSSEDFFLVIKNLFRYNSLLFQESLLFKGLYQTFPIYYGRFLPVPRLSQFREILLQFFF